VLPGKRVQPAMAREGENACPDHAYDQHEQGLAAKSIERSLVGEGFSGNIGAGRHQGCYRAAQLHGSQVYRQGEHHWYPNPQCQRGARQPGD
jgi:hypothetical protein